MAASSDEIADVALHPSSHYARRVRFATLALLLLVLAPGCRRHRGRAHVQRVVVGDAGDAGDAAVEAATAALEDRCKRHDDCVKVELYVDGPLRCCLACGAQAALAKSSADAFIAACAQGTEMRECPIYDCKAPAMDALCVAGHCMLRPRP